MYVSDRHPADLSGLGFSLSPSSIVRSVTHAAAAPLKLVKKSPVAQLVKASPLTRLVARSPLARAARRLPIAPLGPMGAPVLLKKPPLPRLPGRSSSGPAAAARPRSTPTSAPVAPLATGAAAAAAPAMSPISSSDGAAPPSGLTSDQLPMSPGISPPSTEAPLSFDTNTPGLDQPDVPSMPAMPPDFQMPQLGPNAVISEPDDDSVSPVDQDTASAPGADVDADHPAAAPAPRRTLRETWSAMTPKQKLGWAAAGVAALKLLAFI